jgi:hypothetical protein
MTRLDEENRMWRRFQEDSAARHNGAFSGPQGPAAAWPEDRKSWPIWLRRYVAAPPELRVDDTRKVHLHLIGLMKRKPDPRVEELPDDADRRFPGILIGANRPSWNPDCELGEPCIVCGDHPLPEKGICLGCCRTFRDPV